MAGLFADKLKEPISLDDEESMETPKEEEGEGGEDGMMAIKALDEKDGAAFEEAIRRIVGK